MSDIQHRLRASVRMDAVHGDTHERSVCARQMVEAADEIERLTSERDALAKDAQPERQPGSEPTEAQRTIAERRLRHALDGLDHGIVANDVREVLDELAVLRAALAARDK